MPTNLVRQTLWRNGSRWNDISYRVYIDHLVDGIGENYHNVIKVCDHALQFDAIHKIDADGY